jgi:hypothetical protein
MLRGRVPHDVYSGTELTLPLEEHWFLLRVSFMEVRLTISSTPERGKHTYLVASADVVRGPVSRIEERIRTARHARLAALAVDVFERGVKANAHGAHHYRQEADRE